MQDMQPTKDQIDHAEKDGRIYILLECRQNVGIKQKQLKKDAKTSEKRCKKETAKDISSYLMLTL